MEVLLCEHVNDLRHSLYHLNCFITTAASEVREKAKVTGSKVWTIGRQLNWEKENSEFKPVKLRLKIDLVSYPVRA